MRLGKICGRRDSNPQPTGSKPGALSIELRPQRCARSFLYVKAIPWAPSAVRVRSVTPDPQPPLRSSTAGGPARRIGSRLHLFAHPAETTKGPALVDPSSLGNSFSGGFFAWFLRCPRSHGASREREAAVRPVPAEPPPGITSIYEPRCSLAPTYRAPDRRGRFLSARRSGSRFGSWRCRAAPAC